jgi:hypothetical protein
MLVAAVSSSKVADDAVSCKRKKQSINYFMSVPKADTTALYLCHPYATVTADGDDDVRLSVTCETHQWLPCCESTSAAELLQASDSDSESEDTDVTDVDASIPNANHGGAGGSLATNIKDEVAVDWYAVDGPVVANEQSASYLTSMLVAVAEQMGAAQRVQSRPPRRPHVNAAGSGERLATAAHAASGSGAFAVAGPQRTDVVPPMTARTASGRAFKRPSHLSAFT